MLNKSIFKDAGEDLIAHARDLMKQKKAAVLRAGSGTGASPTALEAKLAEISAEVTAEAVERLGNT
jgi:hypothetical protein